MADFIMHLSKHTLRLHTFIFMVSCFFTIPLNWGHCTCMFLFIQIYMRDELTLMNDFKSVMGLQEGFTSFFTHHKAGLCVATPWWRWNYININRIDSKTLTLHTIISEVKLLIIYTLSSQNHHLYYISVIALYTKICLLFI